MSRRLSGLPAERATVGRELERFGRAGHRVSELLANGLDAR